MSRDRLNYYVIPILLFIAFSIWRNPGPFIEPRFWAEEASMYFRDVQNGGWLNALTLIENSNFQLLTNIFTKISSYVDIRYAPFVTTYLSAGFSLLLPICIGRIAKEYKLHVTYLYLAVVYLAVAPMSYEIFATSTNIQWYCGAIMFVCLFLKEEDKMMTSFLLVVALLCGLTGIPSVILAPAFLIVFVARRTKLHLYIALVLIFCTAIQATIVLGLDNPSRHFTTSPRLLILPSLLHSVFGYWLAPESVRSLGTTAIAAANFIPIALASGLIITSLFLLNDRKVRFLAALIILVGFGTAIVQTFGALGNPLDLLGGPTNGGRYYFVSTVAMTLTIMLSATDRKYAPMALLSCAVFAQGIAAYAPSWAIFSSGPSWINSVNQCQNNPCSVDIWPTGLKAEIQIR